MTLAGRFVILCALAWVALLVGQIGIMRLAAAVSHSRVELVAPTSDVWVVWTLVGLLGGALVLTANRLGSSPLIQDARVLRVVVITLALIGILLSAVIATYIIANSPGIGHIIYMSFEPSLGPFLQMVAVAFGYPIIWVIVVRRKSSSRVVP